jgi:hypothetical protein
MQKDEPVSLQGNGPPRTYNLPVSCGSVAQTLYLKPHVMNSHQALVYGHLRSCLHDE